MSMANLDLTKPLQPQVQAQRQPSFAELVRSKVSTVLTGKKADDFITATVSLLNQSPELDKCDKVSIVAAALQAQSLNLPLHRALGQAWIMPFKDNKHIDQYGNVRMMATFVIGYKGLIQLAIRTGVYRKLNALEIKDGELIRYDPLNEELEVDLIQDDREREKRPTIGYFAMFEYTNGFRKCIYWTKAKMAAHAEKYSQSYKNDLKYNSKSSFWSKDFDAMALKTMLRQIITKWGIMSIELQKAMDSDMRIVRDVDQFGDIVDAESNATDTDIVSSDAAIIEAEAQAAIPAPADPPKKEKPANGKKEKKQDVTAPVKDHDEKNIQCPKEGKGMVSDEDCFYCKEKSGCPAWEPAPQKDNTLL